jgi:uncharacterized protein YaiE (UPF0345 family)
VENILQEKEQMSEFNNVTIIKQANVYFDGKVTSRTIKFSDGTTKSLGVMLRGEAFEVPADSKFKLKINVVTDYCCSYVQ